MFRATYRSSCVCEKVFVCVCVGRGSRKTTERKVPPCWVRCQLRSVYFKILKMLAVSLLMPPPPPPPP